MNKIIVNEKISCIEASDHPLSADVGIIRENDAAWLYDVGNGENPISELKEGCNVVLSHFHADHIGNIGRLRPKELYLSKETYGHLPKEMAADGGIHIVTEPVSIGNLYIFPLPSSHAKGSLGLEIDGTYAFVGDALYCKAKNDRYVYNAQLLKEEIDVLNSLRSPFLLVSHFKGLVRKKEDVLEELKTIYAMREKDCPEILIGK